MLQFNRPYLMKQRDEDEEGGSSAIGGGGQGKIEFTDFTGMQGAPLRDDLLPPDEIRRLLVVAASGHKELVKKEKVKRDTIKALKEERMSLQDYRQQMGGGANQYKANPILANKVQFSGASPEVTSIPTDSNTKTNEQNKNELTNEYRLTHQLRYDAQPKFNPQPKPY